MSKKEHSGIKRGSGGGKKDPATLLYKEFEDEPLPNIYDDTDDYGPNGAETTKWFEDNSNFREILSSATDDDKIALHKFSTGYFMDGQQYGKFSSMHSSAQDYVRSYDRMLDQSVVNANVTLTRFATPELLLGGGRRTTTLTELQAMKGRVITSKANLSSAAAKEGLTIGDTMKTVEYKIHIPKGSRGAGMYIGVDGIHAWGEHQREFLLNRDTKWVVGNTREDKGRGVFEVDMYYDGRLPHDYN